MADKKLEEIVSEYAELAKDKNVDAAALMINALQQQDQNKLSSKSKRWAYLISLGVPPVGYLLGLYYYFMKDESDAKTTAYLCFALTTVSLLLTVVFFNVILSSSGTSLKQIEQIKPTDIYQLTQ